MLDSKLISRRIGNRWPVFIDDVVIRTPRTVGDFRDKIEIVLEPGVAFGSGCHETTQLCIRAVRGNLQAGDRVLDVGCGSGILSILAAKCGAGEVVALDIDDNAIWAAQSNCLLNDLNGTPVNLLVGSMEREPEPNSFNLVVANLTYKPIIDLYDRLRAALIPTGLLILSGIRIEQETDFLIFLHEKEAGYVKVTRQNEWLCTVVTI